MAQFGKDAAGRTRKAPEGAPGYSDVSLDAPSSIGATRRWAGDVPGAPSPMLDSASVAHGVPAPHTEGGLQHAVDSLRVAPRSDGMPAPRDVRAEASSQADGGANGSAASPLPSK
jgi:hypothetical protein